MNNLSISILGDIFKGNYIYAIITIVARMFVVFCCLPVHELAHGWAAYKQGDDTAKKLGRLSFNPFSHLDPIGTIMIFLFGIGYAKPVPINPLKFKNYRKGRCTYRTCRAAFKSCYELYFCVYRLRIEQARRR